MKPPNRLAAKLQASFFSSCPFVPRAENPRTQLIPSRHSRVLSHTSNLFPHADHSAAVLHRPLLSSTNFCRSFDLLTHLVLRLKTQAVYGVNDSRTTLETALFGPTETRRCVSERVWFRCTALTCVRCPNHSHLGLCSVSFGIECERNRGWLTYRCERISCGAIHDT